MLAHLLYSLGAISLAAAGWRRSTIAIAVTYPIFLVLLPPTKKDFRFYQAAYESVRLDPGSSDWVQGGGEVTAEPWWGLYTAIVKLVAGGDYRTFLVINFLLCFGLLAFCLRELGIEPQTARLTIALMTPVAFPTIFFWSPRSSISLFIVLLGLCRYIKGRYTTSALLLFAAAMIHSQYIAVAIFCLIVLSPLATTLLRTSRKTLVYSSSLVVVLLLAWIGPSIIGHLSFLPSVAVVESKLGQLDGGGESVVRITALGSVLLVPLAFTRLRQFLPGGRPGDLIEALMVFGVLINIVFATDAHVAGRLSRMSDYLLIPLAAAIAFQYHFQTGQRPVVVWPLALAVPLVYPGLYLQ